MDDKGGCNSDKVAAAIKLIAVVNRGEGGYGRHDGLLPEMRETAVSLPGGVLGGHMRLGVPGAGTGDGA